MGASRSCLMRRVRGGPVGGKSEMRHGWGQTITRSIKDDIQISVRASPNHGCAY